MPRTRTLTPPIHTFRVTLLGGLVDAGPDVWRDIEIAANQTLEDLGHLILHAFDFDEDHMWSFFLSGKPWAYLTGKKRLPKTMPELMSSGDRAEAQWYAVDQMVAWQRTPGALDWLAHHSACGG
jgi:hypothetical protein